MRVAVLASGSGTILESMLGAGVPVSLVVADRPCRALEIARLAAIDVDLIDRQLWGGFKDQFDRRSYTEAVVGSLSAHLIDVVAMAGFATILDEPVHRAYPGRILNTHPSLLPDFPGWHSVEEALAAGVTHTGCTVHLAALEVDSGPVLAQQKVAILPGDTVETLHERIKEVERRLFPDIVLQFLDRLERGQPAEDAPLARSVPR